MAGYRKLGRTSDQRKALLRSQVTSLLYNGKIVTTEAKAKEVKKIAEGLIALAVRERDNYRKRQGCPQGQRRQESKGSRRRKESDCIRYSREGNQKG